MRSFSPSLSGGLCVLANCTRERGEGERRARREKPGAPNEAFSSKGKTSQHLHSHTT